MDTVYAFHYNIFNTYIDDVDVCIDLCYDCTGLKMIIKYYYQNCMVEIKSHARAHTNI